MTEDELRRAEHVQRKRRRMQSKRQLEDDYSEASGPDSVCKDGESIKAPPQEGFND